MVKELTYLDNAATTKMLKEALDEYVYQNENDYGNSQSIHQYGVKASVSLEKARQVIVKSLNASDYTVFFTSSGTEANNWILSSFLGSTIVTSRFEHKSILAPLEYWQKSGQCKFELASVTKEGLVDLDSFQEKLTSKSTLASIMYVNNELGTIQPIDKLLQICRERGVLLHVDACQAFLKIPIDLSLTPVDFMTINSHKVHGPKGVAALLVKKSLVSRVRPFIHGGGHEFGLRSGTVNVAGISSFAKAVEVQMKDPEHFNKLQNLKDYLRNGISCFPQIKLTSEVGLAPHIENMRIDGIEGRKVLSLLNLEGIFISTSSACNSDKLVPSYVLESIGIAENKNLESFRVSMSILNTTSDIDRLLGAFEKILRETNG